MARSARTSAGYLRADDFECVGPVKSHDAKILTEAKTRGRGDLELSEWMKQGWAYDGTALKEPVEYGGCPREDCKDLTVPEFIRKYEAPNLPVLISGLTAGWPAVDDGRWSIATLYENYRHRRFKCGEDDDGYPVKIKLKYFLRYMASQRDDSPLYIFDSMYDDHRRNCPILHDYSIPKYFTDDFFKLAGEHRRPPYRWFLIGPQRSGTGVHVDPLNTSAWNTLIKGRKRWVLFPPHLSKETVKGRKYVRKDLGEDDEPIDYFTKVLPRIKDAGGPDFVAEMMEFTQYPGETIFVPGGWWHAVMNLDDTIAVTQNFCSRTNFDGVWKAARDGRKGMARKLLRILQKEQPDLYARAVAINKADGWDLEAESARHRKRVALTRERRAKKAAAKAAAKKAAAGKRGSSDEDESTSESSSSDSSSESSSSGSETSESEAERCDAPGHKRTVERESSMVANKRARHASSESE